MNHRSSSWLAAALGEVGILLLLCTSVGMSLPACQQQLSPRVLVIGWGGATWSILDPLLRAERLPNLAKMLARGQAAELESVRPPDSAAAWASLSTGCHPGQTGVASLVKSQREALDLKLNTATEIPVPFVWEQLTGTGKRSFVFGAPLSAPARTLDGTLVAGAPVETTETWTRPAKLASELESRGIERDPLGIVTPTEFTIDSYFVQFERKREFLLESLAQENWELGWIVFEELARLHEMCWPGEDEEKLIQAYVRLDAFLGELMALVGKQTDLIVLSERGTRLYSRAYGLHAMVLHEGFAAVNGPLRPFDPPANISDFERRNAEHLHRLSNYEFQMMRATADVCAGNVGSVRLALKGREPWPVIPLENMDFALSEWEDRLDFMESDKTLEPLLERVDRIDELYRETTQIAYRISCSPSVRT